MKKSEKQTTGNSKNEKILKAKGSAADGLRELFLDELKDIIYAERALVNALPQMANNSSNKNLKKAIEEHITVTEKQVKRLESIFEILGESDKGKKCEAMEGLIKEGENILIETEVGPVRDAGIISASQKIEHYEIATYGTLVAFAKTLGENKIVSLLEETLQEEKEADQTLTDAAYNDINFEASEK